MVDRHRRNLMGCTIFKLLFTPYVLPGTVAMVENVATAPPLGVNSNFFNLGIRCVNALHLTKSHWSESF
jgi:hypothetical protein